MHNILRGMNLEAMADIHQSRKKKRLIIFSSIAFLVPFIYSFVNYAHGKEVIALVNIIGALVCAVHLIYSIQRKNASINPSVPSIAVLMNAYINVAEPQGTVFWVYPIVAAILMINEFRTAAIYAVIILIGTISILVFNPSNAIAHTNVLTLSEDKFFFSLFTLCVVTLISNHDAKKSLDYLQSLYQEGIDQLAYRDRLTGLANRWSFEMWANKKLEETKDHSAITALMFLDIDNFKAINDTYGHDAGDKFLVSFAKRLDNNMRGTNRKTDKDDYSVARYAGDEFMILLHNVPTIEDVQQIVERVNRLSKNEIHESELYSYITFSIGIAIYKQDADSLVDLIRCADKAMYNAKNSGKNCYRFYKHPADYHT